MKGLELLKEVVPMLSRVAMLWQSDDLGERTEHAMLETSSRRRSADARGAATSR